MKNTNFMLFAAGYILILVGALLAINEVFFASYLFALGTVSMLYGRIKQRPKSDNFKVRRLNGLWGFAGLLFIVTTYLMFIEVRIWVLTLFLAAFIDFYTSFRYPKEDEMNDRKK